jgi:DNA-binding NarL/FixJ family response regulator
MPDSRRSTVLLADDHGVFTDGVVRLLQDRFTVVGTAPDGPGMIEAANRLAPEVIVMDIAMPGMSGLEALRRLRARDCAAKVIVLTMHAEAKLAAEAMRAGAKGFVLKQSSGRELLAAIDIVLMGQTYLTPALTEDVLALMSGPASPAGVALTDRQQEILRLLVDGRRIKEIASDLSLSPRTIETVKYEMMRDLNVHTTAELVRYAIEHRLLAY